MRFLPVDEPQLAKLEAAGLKRATITDREYPGLGETVLTVDFSGWPVSCLDWAQDEMIYHFCAGLEARKDRIPWSRGPRPLPLERLCKDSREGPLCLPLALRAPSVSGASEDISPDGVVRNGRRRRLLWRTPAGLLAGRCARCR